MPQLALVRIWPSFCLTRVHAGQPPPAPTVKIDNQTWRLPWPHRAHSGPERNMPATVGVEIGNHTWRLPQARRGDPWPVVQRWRSPLPRPPGRSLRGGCSQPSVTEALRDSSEGGILLLYSFFLLYLQGKP